ncbi:MAG: hypothetical protein HQ515_15085 [Phycisphaeraceae bacterium]|nr:hypothetical protein [Phycisphaeraceae bacterium]
MKSFHRGFRLVSVVLVLTFCTGVWGAVKNGGLIGQWHMTLDFETGQMPSILSFTKDSQGALKADWVHIMGVSQVTDIKRAGKDLTFTVETRLGDQDNTSSALKAHLRPGISRAR